MAKSNSEFKEFAQKGHSISVAIFTVNVLAFGEEASSSGSIYKLCVCSATSIVQAIKVKPKATAK